MRKINGKFVLDVLAFILTLLVGILGVLAILISRIWTDNVYAVFPLNEFAYTKQMSMASVLTTILGVYLIAISLIFLGKKKFIWFLLFIGVGLIPYGVILFYTHPAQSFKVMIFAFIGFVLILPGLKELMCNPPDTSKPRLYEEE